MNEMCCVSSITKKLLLFMAIVLLTQYCAKAEGFTLPENLTTISKEMFSGDVALVRLTIPRSVTSIDDRAFSGCSNLGWITISENTDWIGDDVFSGCAEDLLILSSSGSAACKYALDNSIDYQAGTAYRALLIGQTYSQSDGLHLYGPENDVSVLDTCLSRFPGTPYDVKICMDVSAEVMQNKIIDVFGSASEDDVSLFYYSGHGVFAPGEEMHGSLLGFSGNDYVTADQLRNTLDQIQGRKIVIIDACYSGVMIVPEEKKETRTAKDNVDNTQYGLPTADEFAASILSAFSRKNRGSLSTDNYFVMTSASTEEESYEESMQGRVMGLFTYNLAKGLGYVGGSQNTDIIPIDANKNGVVTLQESYQYTRKQLLPKGQHVQVYPSDCRWFGLFRETE